MDLVLLVILARTCYNGFVRGALAEAVNLVGVVTITALACNYHGVIALWLAPWWVWDFSWLSFVVFLLILLGGMLLFHVTIRKLMELIKWERVHWALQTFGLIFGGVRGAWWAGMMLLMMLSLGVPYLKQSVEERSVLAPRVFPILQTGIETIVDMYPGHVGRTRLIPEATVHLPQLPSELRQ